MAPSDGQATITVALIMAAGTVLVSIIGLIGVVIQRRARKADESPDRRDSQRYSEDELLTLLVNDLRLRNQTLADEVQRLLHLIEERGWCD